MRNSGGQVVEMNEPWYYSLLPLDLPGRVSPSIEFTGRGL